MIISIDHGNRNIKTCSCIFNTGYTSSEYKNPMASEQINYNGKFYTLSKNTLPFKSDKTKDEDFFILTLFAIAKEIITNRPELRGGNYNIELAIGLPLMHYKLAGNFKSYFLEHFKTAVHFEYNDMPFVINCKDCKVLPQTYAAAMTSDNAMLTEYDKSYVVDWGGYTLDVLELEENTPNTDNCRSLEAGVLKMYEEIRNKVTLDTMFNIDYKNIESVLANKPHVLDAKIVNIIEEETAKFVDNAFNTIRQQGIDLRAYPVIFVGGASILLKKYIDNCESIGVHSYIDDICANAKGYYILAKDIISRNQ